ncbi:hypothetical protein MRB56_09115 [Halomonas cupida]|uniref:hypothetical protein n=1 Tax=Halomonas cupida TaxID=44933 RepID=UPI0039B57CBB
MADESLLGGDPNTPDAPPVETPDAPPATPDTPPAADTVTPETPDAPEDKTAEGDKADKAEPEGPPEKYYWAKPEGFEGELDEAALGELEPIAKELGLSNDQANKLLSVHANAMQRQQQQQQEQATQTLEKWVGELKEDSEFGGANFDANVKVAQKALGAFGSDELTQMLNDTGLGSHPALVKAFYEVGKRISEDTMERGSGAGGARPIEERMYPNMSK